MEETQKKKKRTVQSDEPVRKRGSSAERQERRSAERKVSAASKKRKKNIRKRRRRKAGGNPVAIFLSDNWKLLLITVVILVVIALLGTSIYGCANKNASPEKIAKNLMTDYWEGKNKKAAKCFLETENNEDLITDIVQANVDYIAAHSPLKQNITESGTLINNGTYAFVYVVSNLELDNEQYYPCINTFVLLKEEGSGFKVLAPTEITEEMSSQTTQAYTKFMSTNTYKEYQKNYSAFIKKNPGYEDKITAKIGA